MYRVGVIGSTGRGDYGHGLDIVWKHIPRVEIVGVADDNPVGLKKAAAKIGAPAAFADYRTMLDKTKPDIVTIATRWLDQHAAMALACAERGIHMYMEKPFCRNLEECDRVIRACDMTHSRLALAHITRYSPRLNRVRELLSQGAIGTVLEYRGRGKEDKRGGGEDLWVLGSHIFNLQTTLAGKPTWCFATVTQKGRPIQKSEIARGPEGIGPLAGDDVRATFGLPNQATATFQSVRNAGGNPARFALQIYGTKGIIEIATGFLPDVWLLKDPGWSPGRGKAKWQSVSSAGVGMAEPLANNPEAGNIAAVTDLMSAIEENREPLCSARDGRDVIEMILAVFESQRMGGPTALPLRSLDNPLSRWT